MWAERSDVVSAIVVSYICTTLPAVSKPCQYSILADYLLSAVSALVIYHNVISRAFTRYWTYTEIAARIIEGVIEEVRKSNTDEHLGRTGGRIVRRGEVETLRSPRLQ